MQEKKRNGQSSCTFVLTYVFVSDKLFMGGEKMNWILLEAKTKERGFTNLEVAKHIGVDPATYHRKKRGESDFYRIEIFKIRTMLNLTSEEVDSIFFNL